MNYSQKYIEIPEYEESGKRVSEEKFYIEEINDLYGYKKELKQVFDTLEKE